MDRADWRILAELQCDARLSFNELSRRVNLSAPAVADRVRRREVARADLPERPEHVGPPEVGQACLEQPEHQPGHCPLVHREDARAVGRDACRSEVLVKQTGVRRPVGI